MNTSRYTAADTQTYLNSLSADTLLVYSPTSMELLDFTNPLPKLLNYRDVKSDVAAIEAAAKEFSNIKRVVSIGGGTPTDVAKYLAFRLNAQLTCIPSMLSTNAYSTNKTALIIDSEKITLPAKQPDIVLLDIDLIAGAGPLRFVGLADVLSIHTALKDWRIADADQEEPIDPLVYARAETLLEDTVDYILRIEDFDNLSVIERTCELVREAGELTNTYGSGRPESGSEHIFAKSLEMSLPVPHGISVALGINLMSLAQNQFDPAIAECLRKLGLLDAEHYGISKKLLETTLLSLRPRGDRYSIIDKLDLDVAYVRQLLAELQSRLGIVYPDLGAEFGYKS